MVSPAVRSLPWPLVVNPALAPVVDPSPEPEGGAIIPVATLKQAVCRMVPLAAQRFSFRLDQPQSAAVVAAVRQLIELVISLRSPTGGWPADIPQTPDKLAPYVSEEVEVLLDALAHTPAAPCPPPPTLHPFLDLVPTLLWLIASSSYETMHLLEGVRARVYATDAQFSLRIIRLVPVLELTTESGQAAIDLVTLEAPATHLYLSGHATLRLLDNDLDNQPLSVNQLRQQLVQVMGQVQPELTAWLGAGSEITALIPGQPWQPATVRLRLYLADMGPQEAKALLMAMTAVTPPPTSVAPQGVAGIDGPTGEFTLDDFADTLPDSGTPSPGILGDWLTFIDEIWIHNFLVCYGQRLLGQQVSGLSQGPAAEATQLALTWVQRAYGAASGVVGPNGLFKQTFVHEPVLVADVWPRLRWHMAQTSARLMQWMGGLSAQMLTPGGGWQRGSLQLRSLMSLTTESHRWVIDLSSGKLLPASPEALEPGTVVRLLAGYDQEPVTIADLMTLINQDLYDYAPDLAALGQGTPIHLHRMETAEGCQVGRLALDWYFTCH